MHPINPNSDNWKNSSVITLKRLPKYDMDDFVKNKNLQIITRAVGKNKSNEIR